MVSSGRSFTALLRGEVACPLDTRRRSCSVPAWPACSERPVAAVGEAVSVRVRLAAQQRPRRVATRTHPSVAALPVEPDDRVPARSRRARRVRERRTACFAGRTFTTTVVFVSSLTTVPSPCPSSIAPHRGVGQGEVQGLVVFEQPITRARRRPSSSWSRSRANDRRARRGYHRVVRGSERRPVRQRRSPRSPGIRRVVAPGDGERKVARPGRTFPRFRTSRASKIGAPSGEAGRCRRS